MIFQVIPVFAFVTEFVNQTSSTPLLFYVSKHFFLKKKATPIFDTVWAYERAKEIEFEEVKIIIRSSESAARGEHLQLRESSQNWRVSLRTVSVLLTESKKKD